MIVEADQATVEYKPATDVPGHFLPVQLHLLAEMGRSERPQHAPATNSGRPSATCSPPSRQPNAPSTSTTAATMTVLSNVKML
jgi:hypothetical protein